MQLIIEIYAIKNCIEQLRSLAKQYESYTEVFAPSNFSVPSGTPLSRKLTDIRNNYRGIQINLQIVAQFLEYYVNDLENLENRMSNLGSISSFNSNISFGSISETSGLVDKPYEFPKTRLFDGASDVAFADSAITEEVKYATFEDINKIMCGDELLQTKETQTLMQKYHLNSEQALYILHKARGLQFGEKKADGKPYLAPEVLKGEDTQITPIEAAFFNNYMSLANTYQMDALKAIKENSKSSIKDIDNIEKKLRGYNFSSLENYQNAVQTKYALAKDEAKLEVSNFRTKQEWAARIGLSLDQVSKMSDNQLIETIVEKDQIIGSDYKQVLAIGDKVGFSEKDQRRLYKLQSDYNNSSMAILQLEENARVQPYLKVQETQDFQKFHYEVPKVKIEKHYDQHDSGFMYNSSVDEYTYYKNCQEQYKSVSNTEIMGMKNLEAVSDLQSIAELYPEYEKEYYYYLETKGKAGAEQYLNDMKSTFARLSGEYKASKRLEYLRALPENEREKEFGDYLNSAGLVTTNAVVSSVYGVGDGVTGWFENIEHIGDQKRYLSSHEWEKNYFRTAISSEKARTEGKYLINENGAKSSSSNVIDFTKNYGTPVGFTYDVGQGVGNMLPTMVASTVFAPSGVASLAGGVTMGAGIYGGTYHDYMVQGYDESTAHKAAALSAIAETVTEELYGGFSFLNGGPVYNFKTGVINVLKEGGQEVFQDANDPIIRAIVTGEKIDLSKINVPDLLKKEAYTFLVGGATAGVMNLPGQVSSSHSIKVNQSNLNLLGNYYNNGNITMDQLHDLVSSTIGISELENSDITSILKFNKNGLSTISKTANGTINPDLVLALGAMSDANNIVVQQRDLVKNTPALAPYVSNISQNENAVVPDGIKDVYTKYKSLEEKLNSYGEEIKNSAKQFQLKDDSVMGLNKKMQDLKSQHEGLEELLEKYDAGEKVHVPQEMSTSFSEYLDTRYKEKNLSQQIEEIQNKVRLNAGEQVLLKAKDGIDTVQNKISDIKSVLQNSPIGQEFANASSLGIIPSSFSSLFNNQSNISNLTPTEVKTLKSICAVPYVGTLPFNIMALFTKRILSPVTSNMDVQSKIANEGLYHITENEDVAKEIIQSQEVRASGVVSSLGSPKGYYFAGIPSGEDVALNIGNINKVQIAIKFDGSSIDPNDFSYRSFDDGSVVHVGPYKFNSENAQIVYLESVVDDNGNLVYKEISRDRYYEIKKKESKFDLRLIPYQQQVQFHYLTKNLGNLISNVTKTYISDNVSSLLSHSPVDLIRDKVRETYLNRNLDFYNRVNFYNNHVDPTTVGELKQGIINSMPIGLSKIEQARFAYLALSQQLGFDENLQSNPKEGAFEATRDFYQNITDDTVLNRKTVCISWAHIYSDILTSLGIDNKYQAKGHAWVEFDADGILIKADATDGNVMDLTNASLGLETQKFSPINQYSDPLNGIISSPFYSSKEAYDSFYDALKQIDQNIGYIQDEYNTIDKKAIIADTDTTLTEKLKLFSSNYLDGLDFEGAKSLLLNFVSSLNNSDEYEISGTDMIKIRNDGKADIINITSILDENGQYRYFALHEGMGLTEITARDLNALRSQGYLFDNASKLKGYQYNAASGAVSSFINNVVSKVSSLIHLNEIDNTEATNSSFKSIIESGQEINKRLTLDLLQNNIVFQDSPLNQFTFEDARLYNSDEYMAYLSNPKSVHISSEMQEFIDKYNTIIDSNPLFKKEIVGSYLYKLNSIGNILAGRDVSELDSIEYGRYTLQIRELNDVLFQSSSVSDQIQFIQDSSFLALEEGIIRNFDSYDKSVQNEIVKKLLREQTGILDESTYDILLAKKLISSHPEFFSEISSQTLAYLYRYADEKDLILNEVKNRIKNGDLVLDSPFMISNLGPGVFANLSNPLWRDIINSRSDIKSDIINLYNSMNTPLYNSVLQKLDDNLDDLQRLSLASLIYHNKITEKNINAILHELGHSKNVKNVNFGIYQDEIIQDLGFDLVNSVARFPNLTSKIISLKEQSPSSYQLFKSIVQDSSLYSSYLQEELVIGALPYLSRHASMDFSHVNVRDFEQFLLVSSAHPELNLEYKNNFTYYFRQVWENRLNAANSIEEGKNAYFMAKYSMSLEEVHDFLHTYGTNIEEVSDEMNLLDYKLFNTLKEELSQNNLDELKKMYSNSSNYTKYQMLDLGSSIKSLYTQEYANAFKQTKALLDASESKVVDGVKVITVQGNFDLLLRSTNSGVNQFGISKPDSWVHSYENPLNPSAVGVSTCYVNQDNFSYMKTGDAGVLYAYVPSEASSILTMGTQDIDAQVTSYGARANAGSQYVLPNHMAEYNTRGYSEFEISFDKTKPDYVVLMSDASEQVRNNTFEAAKEWGIPVLEIDVEQLANQQVNNIKSNIEQFRSTGDCQYLLKAISLYESSANSFNFNAIENNEGFFDDRSHLKGLFDAIPLHQIALEYAHKIVNDHNSNEVLQFKNGLQNILNYYKNTNENSRVVSIIPHTSNITGIESVIDVLNQNSDSGSPSGGDSLDSRFDSSIIKNNDELGLESNDMGVGISLEITEDLYPTADLNSLNSSLSEAVRLSSLQHLLNIGNQIINSPTFFSHPLQTMVASLANAIISKYMFNSNVVNNQEMSNKILNEGLYHFVQNDETMGKILDSHKFLASSSFGGGYVNTAFFFAGVPNFNETSNHIYKYSNLVDKLQGFRLNVDSSQLSEYQYRVAHDGVVMHLGDVEFRDDQITPVYFVLKNENGNIGYVEVSKEEYDNYESPLNKGIIIDQNILGAVNEYALNIDNVDTFKRVFSDFKIGLTNGQVVKSFVSNTLNLLNMIPGVNFDLPINQSVNAKRVSEDLQTRLETLRRENPGIEEDYIRIEKEMSLEHAVRLTPEMVEYRSIMHQLGLDKNNNVNNQQVETLPIEDDTFTVDDIKTTVLDVSLYNNKYFTVTLVDPKSIYAIIFDPDVYHNFMDFNNHRNEFGDISYPLYLKAIEKFISIELDGRNFGSEISQRIFNLLELTNRSNDYLSPVKTYNIDETATSYQVKKNRLEALINQYPSLLTNKNDVPLEVIKEANLLQKAIQGSKYDSLIEASVPCLELSSNMINGEVLPIPVELIEQILSDEKTYLAFQDFNQSRFIFGDVSARDYYRAIMLYYLEAKKNGKSVSDFKNLEDLLQSMNLYLTPFEVGVVNSGGAPVTLYEMLTHNLKDFLKYLNPKSVIVSGENQYTVDEAMAILNNEIGVVPVSFYDNLAEIDPASFKIKLDVNEGIDDISWVDSVLNDETAFDELMNQFNYKMVSERIESLRRYVEEKGASITKLESERYQKIIDKHQQMRDVISLVQNIIFKKPELYSQIKDFVNKETDVSNVKIHGKEFNKDSFMTALDQINSGVQKYEQCRQAFQNLVSTFFTGKNSDVDTLRNVYNAFVYAYNQGYTDLTMAYLNNLMNIKNEIPEFCFTCNTIERAFYSRAGNVIELGKNSQCRETIYHEITHAFDRYLSNYEVSSEWDSMVERTKEYILNNRTHDAFSKAAYRIVEEANRYADSELQNIYHKTTEEILHDLEVQYENVENIKDEFMKKVNSLYGLNEEKANKLLTIITPKYLASIEYGLMRHVVFDHYLRNNYSDIVAISDMIDGVFLGKAEEIDKHHIFLPSIHGETYYQERTHGNAIEAIANYGSLMFTKNGLRNLKFVMGQEYVDMLNQKHHNIVWRNQK